MKLRHRATLGVVAASLASVLVGPSVPAAHGSSTTLTGLDGLLYNLAPIVVAGEEGEYFPGFDFDQACHYGTKLSKGIKQIGKLAKVIHRSGRRVVFTVGPSKTFVLSGDLDQTPLPHGLCDTVGLQEQAHVLDTFPDRSYLSLRRELAAEPGRTFWKTDPHWTGLGGSVFARALAGRLDPKLARRQRYRESTYTATGLFSHWLGDDGATETVPELIPDNGVKVRTAPGSPEFNGLPDFVTNYSWSSRPASRTLPGHTLLIGDSFTLYALRTLRPLFQHGRFLAIARVDDRTMSDAIVDADTVVIEVAQWLVPHNPIATKSFRFAVHRALRSTR